MRWRDCGKVELERWKVDEKAWVWWLRNLKGFGGLLGRLEKYSSVRGSGTINVGGLSTGNQERRCKRTSKLLVGDCAHF